MDSTKEHIGEQRILSFCYGYGGLERGISQCVPTRTVAYVEIEAFQNFNLVAAMESGMVDSAPIWTDLTTFDAKPFRNRIHGIVGGYPCQGESLAGKRKLWDDPRFLWPHIERAIKASKPIWCFFENVSGHLTGSFPYILESLRSMGYAVEAGLFTAEEVGAPHERKRLFIFAMENTKSSYWGDSGIFRKKKKWPQTTDQFTDASRENEMANTGSKQGGLSQTKKRGKQAETFGSSNTVADTQDILLQGCKSRSGKEQPWGSGSQLANTSGIRRGKDKWKRNPKFINKNDEKWPVRPGQEQYQWEEPRTAKPGLGCTVNGYNFRTELLRQFGNGVVYQQSEFAFKTLVTKLLADNKIM